jgi:RNA polymerase sigma-70 factor, ECF subfamily
MNLDTESDEELFSKFGSEAGEKAFHILYERHAARVYAYCARILGNADEAKDVFQDSFIRLYQKGILSCVGIRVAPYLFTIARNACLSCLRARKDTIDADECRLASDEVSFEKTERITLVQRAIQHLELAYREPLVLREYNGLSYDDIAALLSLPVSTVKIRIYRAKEKMRVFLSQYFKER